MSPCGFTLHFLPSVFGHVFWLTGRQSFVPSSNFLCVLLHTFHSNMPSFINHLFRYCFLNIVFCVFHKHVLSIWHIYCYLYFYSHMLYFYYINLFLLSKGLALYQLSLSVLLQPWCESVPIPFNSLCPTCKDRQPPPPQHSQYPRVKLWTNATLFTDDTFHSSFVLLYKICQCEDFIVLWGAGLVFHSTECSLTYLIQCICTMAVIHARLHLVLMCS